MGTVVHRPWLWGALALLAVTCPPTGAMEPGSALRQVEALLERDEPPPGVVFEIVTGEADGLRAVLPTVRGHIARLRTRFPGLALAVVTHGREQFALQSARQETARDVHRQVQVLVEEQAVPVHVCETYAGWHGIGPEDFPDYVAVAPSGPAQVGAYRDLGYAVIMVH